MTSTSPAAVAAALDSFAAGFDELIAAADEQAARLLEAAAQTLVPTDTGRLAASASFGSGTISYGVPYAVCVFGGTVTMVARPWIIDAAEQVESERLAIYEAAIAAAWEQL